MRVVDDQGAPQPATIPTLEEMQHWTGVIGRSQQMMLEAMSAMALSATAQAKDVLPAAALPAAALFTDPARLMQAQADFWSDSLSLWQRFLKPVTDAGSEPATAPVDKRFADPQWRDNPVFDMIRQSYLLVSDHLLKGVDAFDGLDPRQRDQARFAMRAFSDAMSPANFALTNPQVIARTIETKGANLLKGLEHMLADVQKGQVTHSAPDAFEVGRNIATTPGKVVHETDLYQLIQYAPTTDSVFATPLVIFPPWINRYYILDLSPEKSFVAWAVAQGLTVFMVSWKSADASMAEIVMDDYVLRGEIDAIDTVRDLLGVESAHAIGYCVAGTALAAALALLAARGEAHKVASATFFTAQVDFADAGDLGLFIGDEQMKLIDTIAGESGLLDGRYMAATFNLLRGRELIWNYVVSNYLMGEEYPPFDLLHWNGDTTNLPLKWHRAYLEDYYRDNKLVAPGGVTIDGTPIDLGLVETPSYVQAGREDHIAPPESVWKITRHFRGDLRFVLAGSGHIAGVVNHPDKVKYQYWTNAAKVATLEAFITGADETKGSWWPDWSAWIAPLSGARIAIEGARVPGGGSLPVIEDAPGRYVRTR